MKFLEKPGQIAPERPTFHFLLILALLCVPLFFFRLGAWGLFDADEGRYAEIPRAMLQSGDWVTPYLNGVKFFDKPPLLYWLGALFFQIFGVNEFAARLAPALAATLAVFATFFLGRQMFGPRAGFWSAAILATSAGWPILGRVVLTDMLVSSLVFVALAFWWIGRSQSEKKAQTWLFLGFWAALALGVLAKGPIAVVLTFGSIATYTLFSGEWAIVKKMRWLSGAALFLAIAAPWFWVVQARNPEYFKAFWIDQNFGRFLGILAERDHDNGPLYFLQFLPILFLPWTFFAPHAVFVGWKKMFKRGRSERERALLFLVCSSAFITIFFSGSQSKLVTYILPVVPLMALALGGYFDWLTRREKFSNAPRNAALFLALFCFVGGALTLVFAPPALEPLNVAASSVWAVSAALLLWGAIFLFCAWKKLSAIVAATAGGFALFFGVATNLVVALAPALTTPGLVKHIRPGLDAGGELVSLEFAQSLSFYTGKRIAIVERPDELRSALSFLSIEEKQRWFMASERQLKPYFGRKTPVYLVLRASRKKSIAQRQQIELLGADFAPVFQNARYLVLGNQAARKITPLVPN